MNAAGNRRRRPFRFSRPCMSCSAVLTDATPQSENGFVKAMPLSGATLARCPVGRCM
jgi:hypothetical protein